MIRDLGVCQNILKLIETQDLDVLNNALATLAELTFRTNDFSHLIISCNVGLMKLANTLYGMSDAEFMEKCNSLKHQACRDNLLALLCNLVDVDSVCEKLESTSLANKLYRQFFLPDLSPLNDTIILMALFLSQKDQIREAKWSFEEITS